MRRWVNRGETKFTDRVKGEKRWLGKREEKVAIGPFLLRSH